MVVKNPVARARSSGPSESIQRWISSFEAPAG
jgi:hypothetical protein